MNKVVQYHRRKRLHIAPEPESLTRASRGGEDNTPVKPQLNWTAAKWAVLGAWLPLILAQGIAVVPSGMGGIRVSQTSGTRPGTLYPGVLSFRRKSKRDLPPPGQARSGGKSF